MPRNNGLPGDDEEAANVSIEAALRSRNPRLARQLTAWFEEQWCASCKIEQWHLDRARDMWSRRHRTGGRGFTTPLTDALGQPEAFDRFAGLRLVAYLRANRTQEAVEFIEQNHGLYFTDEEWQGFGDENPGIILIEINNGPIQTRLLLQISLTQLKVDILPPTVSGRSTEVLPFNLITSS